MCIRDRVIRTVVVAVPVDMVHLQSRIPVGQEVLCHQTVHGEKSVNANLTNGQAEEIRVRYSSGQASQNSLADVYKRQVQNRGEQDCHGSRP